jgi:hypothetical protein
VQNAKDNPNAASRDDDEWKQQLGVSIFFLGGVTCMKLG